MLKYLAAAKVLKQQKARVDNAMFHLHYRVTFIVFMTCSALITAKEYFGSPIQCLSRTPIRTAVLNTYCFIMSTFSVPRHTEVGLKVPFPGVGPHTSEDELVYHTYYQWVPIMLFCQGLSFYFPRFMWKSFEGGLFTSILQGMDKVCIDEGEKTKKYKVLLKYMTSHANMHRNWAIRFFVCELMCLVIVVSNIYIMDAFLGGTFLTYGTEVMNFPDTDIATRIDPMNRIFPEVTKCTFRMFGMTGTIETHDALCILAINVLNEKIYIALWFWMVILTAITALALLYRMLIILSTGFRSYLLSWRGRLAGRAVMATVCHKCPLGDWFLLYHLGRCMSPGDFGGFLKSFARELDNHPPSAEGKPMLAG